MVEYSIVIPVFKAAEYLREMYERLTKVFQDISSNYEIIFVDDASPDVSWKIMKQLRAKDHRVKIIQHMRNFGQHKAILCGLYHSKGDFVITMDDDLQHPPEEIPKLVEAIRNNDEIDTVIGAYEVKQHSWFRNLGTNVINAITSYVFSKDKDLKLTSFRIMRRSIVNELENTHYHNPRIGQLLLLTTNRIINIPVAHHPRKHGRTSYTFRRLVSDALDNILSNSSLPLQIVSYLGFGSSLLSVVLSVYYLYKYFHVGISVPGWTTTILLLLFFFGILFFSLGIVGEYLIRILREVQGSPRSIIRNKEL
jgi:dolichol-phosphate mannosyltransferase/undecaprenyl-phosphate 4-deoxy-4-formamido-L-arabinose transferase